MKHHQQVPATDPTFPVETLRFLRDLKSNNNREWFGAHKSDYETIVKAPLLAFAESLSREIESVAPEYATPAEKAVQRIYRDIRFSPNKTPYRTELAMLFSHRTLGKKSGSGIYVALSPDELLVAGGLYQQDTTGLYAARQYLFDNLKAFQNVLNAKGVKKLFGDLHGDSLKRPPRGFPPEHSAIDLLKRTQWLLSSTLPRQAATEPGALKAEFARIHTLFTLVQFFEPPLLKKAKPVILVE